MSQEEKNAEFDEQWTAFGASAVVPALGGNNDKFKPEIGVVYDRIAILREPSWEIPSKNPTWAPSVAVNVVNLEDGNRMDWWFASTSSNGRNSIFRDRLSAMLDKAKEDGHNYPIEFKFRIRERESKFTGNTYKELQPIFVASGDNIKGDLGLNPRDDPANDISIPAQSSALSQLVEKASSNQWTTIKDLAKEIFPEGYTATQLLDAINAAVEEGHLTLQSLIGSGSIKIVGKGDLSAEDATHAIKALTDLLGA